MSVFARLAPFVFASALAGGLVGCHGDDTVTGSGEVDRDEKPGKDAGKNSGKDAGKDAGRGRVDAGAADDPGDDDDDNPPDDTDKGCGTVRAQADLQRGPIDIIIALDTSGSMSDEICNVSKNLTTFASGVGATAHVVADYEMGTLGIETFLFCGSQDPLAATPLASDANRYLHVPTNIDSWKALTNLVDDFDQYKSFLRPDAPTNFVVVSDDESNVAFGGMLATDFEARMKQLLGHDFVFHAIVADGQNGCRGSNVGTQYLQLADDTGGQKLPICATDWSAVFAKLEAAVASQAEIPCDFEIPAPPDGSKLDVDAVQVVYQAPGVAETQFPRAPSADKCGTNTAWYYNDPTAPTRVQLCPSACAAVKQGGDVNIAFGCAPPVVM